MKVIKIHIQTSILHMARHAKDEINAALHNQKVGQPWSNRYPMSYDMSSSRDEIPERDVTKH